MKNAVVLGPVAIGIILGILSRWSGPGDDEEIVGILIGVIRGQRSGDMSTPKDVDENLWQAIVDEMKSMQEEDGDGEE